MRIVWSLISAIVIGIMLVFLVPKVLVQVMFRTRAGIAKQTKLAHMERIREGITDYRNAHSRLPSNLEEVVKSGELPAMSKIYWNPLKHNSPEERTISYIKCEFDILWSDTGVVISLPRGTSSNEWDDLDPFWKQSVAYP